VDLNLILVCVVIVAALFFSYTNGFHDAANAIATSVSTRAWTPRAALLMAATMNVIGAMMGTAVAKTVGKGIISISDYAESPLPEMQQKGLVIILAALLGACIWNLITWWFGLPSSSSHALIGGMAGARPPRPRLCRRNDCLCSPRQKYAPASRRADRSHGKILLPERRQRRKEQIA